MQQSQDLNEGWIILILLGSLAVSVSTVSFGLGFVNLVAGEMAPPPPPSEQAPGSLGKGTPLPSDEAALRRQVERVRAQLSRMRDDERALADEVAEKTRLTAGSDAPPAIAATVAESDTQRLRQAREEIAELEQQTRNLRKQIVDRKSVDASSLFGGGNSTRQPRWVECIADALILHPEGTRVPVGEIENKSGPFADVLRSGYVVMLVRPSGFESFAKARQVATERKVLFGYEPVDDEWVLRFQE